MTPQTEVPVDTTPATAPAPAPKAGYKSSELVVTLVTAVAVGSSLVPPSYAPLVAALAGFYVAARTLLKVVHALGYAKAIPDLPQLPSEK